MTAVATAPATVPGTIRTARHRAASRRSLGRRALGIAATLIVVLTGLVLIGMTLAPRVFHYRTATMLTGSMVPTINPGDVIVDTEEPVADLRPGQIITYHIPVQDHRVESHRIVWLRHEKDGAVLFRTKGDANNGVDPWTAKSPAHSKVWIVRTVLPVVGDVIRFLRQPLVQLLFTRVLPAVLVIVVLFAIWRPSRRAPEVG